VEKWQHVVNMLFKVEEALPHLQDAITKGANRKFENSNSMLTMKFPKQIVKYTNKSLLHETSAKCLIIHAFWGLLDLMASRREWIGILSMQQLLPLPY